MRQAPFYVIGNWKSNKTVEEAVIWMQDLHTLCKKQAFDTSKVKAILCPGFIHLTTLKSLIETYQLPIELGAQTISSFPNGAYTGEVSATMLVGLVKYALIGHSERRKYFHEGEELPQKITEAQKVGLIPIYCIQDENDEVPKELSFVAYEPVWAIGTGKPDTAENANRVAGVIKQKRDTPLTIIYGGSVTAENVGQYAKMESIGGVLPGGASLMPATFYNLLTNASAI